jgi:hypothetical protein
MPEPERINRRTSIFLSFADRRHHTEDIRRSICAALGWTVPESYKDLRVYNTDSGTQFWISEDMAPRERINELVGLLILVFDPDSITLRRSPRQLPKPLRASIKERMPRKQP